ADSGSWMSNPNQRLYRTEVALDAEVPEMRPGMSCSIEVLVEDLSDVLYVPRQSVFLDAGKTICFVSDKGTPVQREVEIGRDNNKFAHVVSGLEEGDVVLLSPPSSWEPAPPPEEAAPKVTEVPEGGTTPGAETAVATPAADAQPPARPAGAGEGSPGGPGMGGFSAEQVKAMRERYEAMSDEEKAAAMKRFGGGGGDRSRGNRSDGEEE
ncbi:MAG: hypothetical protein QGI93_11490, partial [Planctomycetota bacterium]|nr:hypothetical protein [Planctomycetota bacterium]